MSIKVLLLIVSYLQASVVVGQGSSAVIANRWKTLVASAAAAAMIQGTTVADPWKRVRVAQAKEHQRASFYIAFDLIDLWRVMHVQYLGQDQDQGLLFVGARHYLVADDNDNEIVIDGVEASLVGLGGLVERGIDVEEQAILSHPTRSSYDLSILKVKGVTLKGIKPLTVADSVGEIGIKLEMLSYRRDEHLGFWLPMYRPCISGLAIPELWWSLHTCTTAVVPSSLGSPIFIEESGELYGFFSTIFVGGHIEMDDGRRVQAGVSIIAPQALSEFIRDTLPVNPDDDKMTTTWGQLKKR